MAGLVSQKDDVMVQGTSYEEEGDILDAEEQDEPQKGKKGKGGDSGGGSGKVIAIVAGVIFVIVIAVFGMMKIMPAVMSSSEEEETELTEPPFEYMDIEIENLRDAGYTGDEIEQFESEMIPADTLIEEAEERRKAIYESEVAPYWDNTSDEYKFLEEMTWVGGEEFDFNIDEIDGWERKGSVLNLDYKKVPLHGYQCFLRIEMRKANPEKGRKAGYCYMFVDPERYAELDDEGNINVQISYYFIPETKTSIVTDIHEVRTTDN